MKTREKGDDFFDGKSLGEALVEGFGQMAEALKSDKKNVPTKFTFHKISLNLEPTPYDPSMVKETRELLGASQAVFAKFVGVSVKTVQAWEQGTNPVRDTACRLMDEIRHDPEYWQARIRELAVRKTKSSKKTVAS